MVFFVEKIVISTTTEEAIMHNKFWNQFYETGKISDYLKYVNAAENSSASDKIYPEGGFSGEMEKMQHAGKSDRDGSFGYSRGGIR